MTFFDTKDRLPLYVRDVGTGPAVVLIHGWPLQADMWEHQIMALAEAGYRVLAYDRRGFGRSAQPWTGYDYDTLADDLYELIDQSGARDAAIVGFSMGGGEVARYMSRHGGRRVARAALVSAVTPFMKKTDGNPDGVDPSVFDEMEQSLRKDRPGFLAQFGEQFYGTDDAPDRVSQAWRDWTLMMAMQGSVHGTLKCADSFATTDFRGDLSAFDCPTLIVHGTADKVVPIEASGDRAAKAIPHATYERFDGAPHGLFATNADQLTDSLLRFMRS